MRIRFFSLALALGLLATLTAAPLAASAQTAPATTNPLTNIPVTGSIPSLPGGAFNGTLNITSFATQNGALVANGLLSGTLTQTINGVTSTVGTVTNLVVSNIPVGAASSSATCTILDLTLGPLDLNLLGLMVHLDQVHLTITAQQAPGNLLGNLLCAVAHLLDSNGSANALSNLLNHVLAIL
jgi:hypothetical protein